MQLSGLRMLTVLYVEQAARKESCKCQGAQQGFVSYMEHTPAPFSCNGCNIQASAPEATYMTPSFGALIDCASAGLKVNVHPGSTWGCELS